MYRDVPGFGGDVRQKLTFPADSQGGPPGEFLSEAVVETAAPAQPMSTGIEGECGNQPKGIIRERCDHGTHIPWFRDVEPPLHEVILQRADFRKSVFFATETRQKQPFPCLQGRLQDEIQRNFLLNGDVSHYSAGLPEKRRRK